MSELVSQATPFNPPEKGGLKGVACETMSEPVSRKAKYSDRDLGHAPALPGMPSY